MKESSEMGPRDYAKAVENFVWLLGSQLRSYLDTLDDKAGARESSHALRKMVKGEQRKAYLGLLQSLHGLFAGDTNEVSGEWQEFFRR